MALIERPAYMRKAPAFRATDLVKAGTGVCRCGKSSLLELVRNALESENVPNRRVVSVNLEDREFGIRTDDGSHHPSGG